MENANPPPTNNRPVLPPALHVKVVQELHELQAISTFVDSRLECIEQFLNGFVHQPNEINMDDLESDNESVETPLVSPFLDSENKSDDGEVLNELKFIAYFDPFSPMNIITRKAYNTVMMNGLEGTRNNLVVVVEDVCVFVGSFTYVIDFVVLEDIGRFILKAMAEVLMGKPFREVTKLEYDILRD
ncbi:hypothetical protein Tco_0649933 [Tanacetum coccineum]